MSFVERGFQVLAEKEHSFLQVSATRVPYEIPKMMSTPLMMIGEAPAAEEDDQIRPFVGPSGKLLNEWLQNARLRRGTFALANVFRYRPDNNRVENFFRRTGTAANPVCEDLSSYQGKYLLEHFRPEIDYLKDVIMDVRPEAIVTLGTTALWAILNHDRSLNTFSERPDWMCTLIHKENVLKFTLFPVAHPGYCLVHGDKHAEELAIRGIKAAARFVRAAS